MPITPRTFGTATHIGVPKIGTAPAVISSTAPAVISSTAPAVIGGALPSTSSLALTPTTLVSSTPSLQDIRDYRTQVSREEDLLEIFKRSSGAFALQEQGVSPFVQGINPAPQFS